MTKGSKKTKVNVRVNKTKKKEKPLNKRLVSEEEFIKGFDDKVEHYVENYVEKVERTKMLTLISGVGFFMLLIVFLYVYSFKSQIMSLESAGSNDSGINVQMDEVKNSIGNIINSYKEIKETAVTELNKVSTSSNQTELENMEQNFLPKASTTKEISEESIKTLKGKLLDKKIVTPTKQE